MQEQERLESTSEERSPINEELISANIRGNKRFPQMFASIATSILDRIFSSSDPVSALKEYLESLPSKEQFERIHKAALAMHERNGVYPSVRQIVTVDRIKDIYIREQDKIKGILSNVFVRSEPVNFEGKHIILPAKDLRNVLPVIERIAKDDPESIAAFSKLINEVDAVVFSEEMTPVSLEYKEQVVDEVYTISDLNKTLAPLRTRIEEMCENMGSETADRFIEIFSYYLKRYPK